MIVKFKSDKFKKVRGGYSRLLEIRCQKCEAYICLYQKDGPGNLRRMYVDRMFDIELSVDNKTLQCKNNHVVGIKMIYEKEKRKAFRLFVDSVMKKIVKIT